MVLVTGGNGLVGAYLLYKLVNEYFKVRALKRDKSDLSNLRYIFNLLSDSGNSLYEKIEWVNADVTDYRSLADAMEGVEKVYHCAGVVSFDRRRKKELFDVNIKGTANLVNAALEKGARRICHVSSIAAMGMNEDKLCNEQTGWVPETNNTYYSISKFRGEMEIWRGVAEGLEAVVVNPSVILGAGFWHKGTGQLVRKLRKGLKHYTNGVTGYIDVRDVAEIMVRLMESDINNQQYILSAENLSYEEILNTISAKLQLKKPLKKASPLQLSLAWRFDQIRSMITGKNPVFTRDLARIAQKRCCYENKKIQEILGYQFIPIRESLSFAVEQYMNSGPRS